jgi:XrtN system VIT domain protein
MESQLTAPGTSGKISETQSPRERSEREMHIGYILLLVSFVIFLFAEQFPAANEENLLITFFAHYFLAMAYAGFLLYHKALGIARSWHQENIHRTILLLNLFLISAYALNRVVAVFQDSVPWLCVYIVLASLTQLSYRYFETLPPWVNRFQLFMLGSALLFYAYLAFFVSGYYVFGSLGTLAFGIGAHVFIPLLLICGSLFLIRHSSKTQIKKYWLLAGATVTVVIAVAFVFEWNTRVTKLERLANQSVLQFDNELPIWVTIGQEIKNDWVSSRILKSDLVYTTAPEKFGEWQFLPSRSGWQETRKHDPLVFLASMKARSSLSEEDRIKILKAISNGRHQAEDRLWSGDHLSTSYIVSDIDIYTDLRLAYTEKYLNIRNNDISQRTRRNTEEALYTFQLPEGSVISSLSLWIHGEEQKGILTSKEKATNAYTTIVGVERRDPSVVHWQEGNTVTVRVFPCTNKEERKFKIGITSPLPVADGQIIYKNIPFYGPDASGATETTRIRFVGSSEGITLPEKFVDTRGGYHVAEHAYEPDFQLSFPIRAVKSNQFTFDGFTYSMSEHIPEREPVHFESIYLDLNRAWSASELNALQPLMDEYEMFGCDGGNFTRLTDANWSEITERGRQKNFSLFPFYRLPDSDRTLVITKGDVFTPHLSDFKHSNFGKAIRQFFAANKKIKVYNLSGGISTYVNSLRELRALQFQQGNVDALKQLLAEAEFTKSMEDDSKVILNDASLLITREKSSEITLPDTAPDHLARLFAYNNIMRQVGTGYFDDDFVNAALVEEASSAYVVSPVSSLIVLESKADYDRFGISDDGKSLYNASKESSGAVPEPHEWALIILFVLFVVYVKFRN